MSGTDTPHRVRLALIEALVDARKTHNLTQAEVGHRIGLSQSVVSRIETHDDPHLSVIQSYASAVGIRVEFRVLVAPSRTRPGLEVTPDAPSRATAIATMFETAPRDWWKFLPCGFCNAGRQEPCQSTLGPARGPHALRQRAGNSLHATLWLLAEGFAGDVLAPQGVSEDAGGATEALATPGVATGTTEGLGEAQNEGEGT